MIKMIGGVQDGSGKWGRVSGEGGVWGGEGSHMSVITNLAPVWMYPPPVASSVTTQDAQRLW